MTDPAAWYPWLKFLHRTLATLSILGFVTRWVLSMRGAAVMAHPAMRIWPHLIDTGLLASAIALAVLASVSPWGDAWLGAKVIGLLAYIGLGMMALGRARGSRSRLIAGIAAIAVYAQIVACAIAKSPWGILALTLR